MFRKKKLSRARCHFFGFIPVLIHKGSGKMRIDKNLNTQSKDVNHSAATLRKQQGKQTSGR